MHQSVPLMPSDHQNQHTAQARESRGRTGREGGQALDAAEEGVADPQVVLVRPPPRPRLRLRHPARARVTLKQWPSGELCGYSRAGGAQSESGCQMMHLFSQDDHSTQCTLTADEVL